MIYAIVTIKNQHRITGYLCSLIIHFGNGNHRVYPDSTARPCICQIDFSIFIPQRSGVNHPLCSFYQHRFIPITRNIFGFHHIDSIIRIAPVNIEFTFMITNARSPNTLSMLSFTIKLVRFHIFQSIINNSPVYQIL